MAGSLLVRASSAEAGDAGGEFYSVKASTSGKCATCAFWGGIRKLSDDRSAVLTQSLGWCNNPESKRFGQLTTPESGPMKSWSKWPVLP